jgi:hypothetical protein
MLLLTIQAVSIVWCYFMTCSPTEPPPPPPEDAAWEDVPSNVVHLDGDTFRSFTKKKKHVLVMFYAPCEFVYDCLTVTLLYAIPTCGNGR